MRTGKRVNTMTLENIALLEVILDAIALFLCGVTIAGVLMLRGRKEKVERTTSVQQSERFNDVLVELVQQTERTFQKVTDALREERELLETGSPCPVPSRETAEEAPSNVTSLSDGPRRRKNRGPRRGKRKRKTIDDRNSGDRYSKVAELARSGMSEQEIAENVALPRNEIELIMALNKG